MLELYAGRATGPGSTIAEYYQFGGRAALFIPVVRPTNILSPKLVLDEMRPLGGSQVPFTLLQTQPDFRGGGSRADLASAVASIDYRWSFVRFISARLFFDVASVAPTVSNVLDHGPRYAAGFGFDFFSRSAELGQIALATGPDGTRFLLSIGVGSSFGDRQHQ